MVRDPSSARPAASGEPDWLTLGQAAKYLGVAQSTIRKWSDQGRVPAFYTPGGHRRFRRGDLESYGYALFVDKGFSLHDGYHATTLVSPRRTSCSIPCCFS